jgi:hypothetical protein
MTLPRPRRNRRPRFNGSPSDHALTEQWPAQLRAGDMDGATYDWFGGGSDIGVMAIAITQGATGPAPPGGYQPEPAAFPALQAAPEPEGPILAAVPVTEAAVIGDELRLPFVWCEMPGCIGFHRDPAALGERDARDRAKLAGWRTDALGRLACPGCQQTRGDYRTPQPVTWHHPEVARRWHAREPLSDTGAFRLGVEAELGRRISYENPALARAIAAATHRTAGAS